MAAFVTPPKTVILTSSANNYQQEVWLTEWMPVIAVKEIQALLEVENGTGNMFVRCVVQVAETNTDEPSATTALSGSQLGDGLLRFDVQDLTSVFTSPSYDTYFWVRFGVSPRVSAGAAGTLQSAEVTLVVSGSSK